MKNKLTILIFVLLGICRIQAQVTAVLTPPTGCESNGMIELTDINGEGPFTIDWSVTTSEPSPSGPPQFVDTPLTEWNNQTKITGLAPGTYCVTVKNAKCCEARYCFDLEKKEGSVKIKYKKNPTSCYAGESIKLTSIVKNGSIEIEVTNPDDWEYLWVLDEYPFGKWDTKDISGLQFGNYTLTATNKTTGCVETLKVFLCCCAFTIIYSDDEPKVIYENNQPAQCSGADIGSNIVSVGHTATPPTSNTANNGSIKLNVKTFGTASGIIYYSWNETTTGKTFATKDISNLPPGEYCYTVTDGCTTFKDCVPIYVCEENPINPRIVFLVKKWEQLDFDKFYFIGKKYNNFLQIPMQQNTANYVIGNPFTAPDGTLITRGDKTADQAQGMIDPETVFQDHAVVCMPDGKIYDPSYGTGPFSTNLDWEAQSVDGYAIETEFLDDMKVLHYLIMKYENETPLYQIPYTCN